MAIGHHSQTILSLSILYVMCDIHKVIDRLM